MATGAYLELTHSEQGPNSDAKTVKDGLDI
jgi:hypothetical protein